MVTSVLNRCVLVSSFSTKHPDRSLTPRLCRQASVRPRTWHHWRLRWNSLRFLPSPQAELHSRSRRLLNRLGLQDSRFRGQRGGRRSTHSASAARRTGRSHRKLEMDGQESYGESSRKESFDDSRVRILLSRLVSHISLRPADTASTLSQTRWTEWRRRTREESSGRRLRGGRQGLRR